MLQKVLDISLTIHLMSFLSHSVAMFFQLQPFQVLLLLLLSKQLISTFWNIRSTGISQLSINIVIVTVLGHVFYSQIIASKDLKGKSCSVSIATFIKCNKSLLLFFSLFFQDINAIPFFKIVYPNILVHKYTHNLHAYIYNYIDRQSFSLLFPKTSEVVQNLTR